MDVQKGRMLPIQGDMKSYFLPILTALLFTQACQQVKPEPTAHTNKYDTRIDARDPGWNDYWYAGDAEVNYYKLEQDRYGENRDAEAVMIWVTEDFSRSKQVKLDNPAAAGDDRVSVMKLNFNRKFVTGIYDYSIMQSVFTPVDLRYRPSLKSTCSVQDWCGQAFSQINRVDEAFRYRCFSYFESEGDTDLSWSGAVLEDEIWTTLRISPDLIPIDTVDMIPSMAFLRLSHMEPKPYKAIISREKSGLDETLEVRYTELDRVLTIRFNSTFPFTVTSWSEDGSFPAGAGSREYHNKASLQKQLNVPYWQYNSVVDSSRRKQLFEFNKSPL